MNEDELAAHWAAETLRMAQEGRIMFTTERDRCTDHEEDFVTDPDQLLLGWRQE